MGLKASELIRQLEALIKKHGDYVIGIRDHIEGNDWEAGEAGEVDVEPQKNYGSLKNDAGEWIPVIHDSFVIE